MTKFGATIEILKGQSAAVITLTDTNGDWAGSSRIEGRRSALYDLGYTHASRSAAIKGGRLETYRVLS